MTFIEQAFIILLAVLLSPFIAIYYIFVYLGEFFHWIQSLKYWPHFVGLSYAGFFGLFVGIPLLCFVIWLIWKMFEPFVIIFLGILNVLFNRNK